jgi:hypothetical protein
VPFADDAIEPFLRLFIAAEGLFVSAERRGVVITSAINYSGRVFDVEHFVKNYEFHKPLRNFDRIQGLADRDRVVRCIMMAEYAARPAL